jgi:diaminopimelate decarboxylase
LTPYDTFTKDTLHKVLSVVDNVTPVYVYDEGYLVHQITTLKEAFQSRDAPVPCNIRYAMKALSNVNILKVFEREGLHFDCSSVYEVRRVIKAGVDPSKIELVAQEITSQ